MKLKSLFLALLVMVSCAVMAQVESGKVYRIVSAKYNTVITANPVSHELSCVTPGGSSDYQQMWMFTKEENGKYSIMNVFTGRYIQNQNGTNVKFKTGSEKVFFEVKENSYGGVYNIDANNRAEGWGLHCDGSSNVVPWKYGPNDGEVSGTEWTFELVSITKAEMDAALAEFATYNDVIVNKAAIVEKVSALFSDKAGTTLKAEYASMSDDALKAKMEGVPADLQQAIIKVKNGSWATEDRANLGEKNFRIYDYKPYSNPEQWKDILYHRPFNRINNPTGICSESDKGFIYVFVDKIPEGAEMWLAEMNGTAYFGMDTQLVEGLNIVPSAVKDGVLYIRYIVDTHTGFDVATKSGPKKLRDYPAVKVHVEGGYVNGFWSKERGHTNEDWVYMGQKMFRNELAVQAVGDHSVLNFRKKEFLQPSKGYDIWGYLEQGCPDKIEEVMKYWDFWNKRQRYYMGLDKYYDYFNNKQLAMSDDGGFMDAGNYRTHYNNNTLNTIVNLDRISRDGGSAWGPLHEIGHTNQYAFEIVGTSEVSNNALANFTIFDTGTHTSRGWNMDAQIKDFENKIPYVVRGEREYGSELFSMTRMYFQLFLYFHAAGWKTDFYPVLFEELRRDRLEGWPVRSSEEKDANGFYKNSVNAKNDQLKFVEKCCSIAQMDLTEFFEAWGFFIPMKNAFVGDYGYHWVYLLQEDIDACKARIKAANYPKKGGHLMFIEDRIRPSKKKESELNDKVNEYRLDYSSEAPVANNFCGLYGQWEDYKDEYVNVKAEGYYYAVVKDKVVIKPDTGAKGALGFKLYDKNNNLIAYTNRHEMNIPVGVDRNTMKVVAAQADGENAEVKHASQGPEQMQLDALKAAVESAKRYIDRKAIDGTAEQIGRFYPEYLVTLEALYKDAKAAYDNKTPGENSYVEWAMMLEDECASLVANQKAMVCLEEGMKVAFMSSTKRKGVLQSTGGGVKSDTKASYSATNAWSLEYANIPNVFYLKDVNGNYMRDFSLGTLVDANTTVASKAQKFTFGYDDGGNVYFSTYSDNPQSFGQEKAEGTTKTEDVIQMNPSDERARWKAKYFENNSEEFYKKELKNTLGLAKLLFTEIINIDSINTMNYFNTNIVVNDRNLETTAIELYNAYAAVNKDVNNVAKQKEYLYLLREKIYNVEGKYVVTTPMHANAGVVAWYRLYNKETGRYLSVNKDDNTLTTVNPAKIDDYSLWGFASTGVAGKYTIGNYLTKGMLHNSFFELYAVGKTASTVIVEYNEDKQGIVLSINDPEIGSLMSVYEDDGYVSLAFGDSSCWELEIVDLTKNGHSIINAIENVLEEGNYNEDIYDLSGRKVINPTRGIYIQNGKKVFFK